jgi:ADP-heptose:LPS heptosyltransferase
MDVAALLLTIAVAQTTGPFEAAFNRLAKVEHFAFGLIGYAPQISQGQKDYELILSRPSALAGFERLYIAGNPEARAYALVGIRKINPERFKQLAQPLRNSQEKVVTMSGCLIRNDTFAGVIRNIESGNYDSYRKELNSK